MIASQSFRFQLSGKNRLFKVRVGQSAFFSCDLDRALHFAFAATGAPHLRSLILSGAFERRKVPVLRREWDNGRAVVTLRVGAVAHFVPFVSIAEQADSE